MSFGIITLASQHDYLKAIGLALSARVSNPGIPLAVVCSENLKPLVGPYFDHVVLKDKTLSGFQHKVYLDRYSPFEETFFFDADVLLFRPLTETLDTWRGTPYSALGSYADSGTSAFGLEKKSVLKKIGKEKLVMIDGAGHAYFKKPECTPVFDLAREITTHYETYAGKARYADEDAMNIAMTILDLKPYGIGRFFSRYISARPGTRTMDATTGTCRFTAVVDGTIHEPYMMHFAAREAPFPYTAQLRKLFRKFGVPTKGLTKLAWLDYYTLRVKWPLSALVRKVRGK